jgi:hypothetical protein
METITHIDRLVTELGGRQSLANALGVGPNMIWVWKTRGAIPTRHIPRLSKLAAAKGVQLDDVLFERQTAECPHAPSPDCQPTVIDAPADYIPPSDGDDVDGVEC